MSRYNWEFYMNTNPAFNGCGFMADVDYRIDNQNTKAFVAVSTRANDEEDDLRPEISFVGVIGNLWYEKEKFEDCSFHEMGRNIYIFDQTGKIKIHGEGFGKLPQYPPEKVNKEDCERLTDIATDLASAQPSLGSSLEKCIKSLSEKVDIRKL